MPASTRSIHLRSRRAVVGMTAATCALLAAAVTAPPATAAISGEFTGTLGDGTAWRAVVPDDWNGTLLLYSHGYQPSFAGPRAPATVAPSPATEQLLLERGYALVGSTYEATGWAVPTAPGDQLESLDAAIAQIGEHPDHVLAYGTSMGGLVTGILAESAGDVIAGAMPTCGLMEGGVDLNNYQLDGSHAINELLAPDQDIQIEGYADLGAAFGTAAALTAAVDVGQTTPEGRARVALAAALFHLPGTDTGDTAAWQDSMYTLLKQTLGFVTPGRFDIETATGGSATWNVGVDYGKLFQQSEDRRRVAELYRAAGLDLKSDLALLTRTADTAADAGSVETLSATSGLTGELQMPVLTMHTTIDILAPVQVEQEYAEDVRSQGESALLRQTFVEREGHCSFTPAEIAAGIDVLEERVTSGHWGAESNSVPRLNALAASIDDSGSAFVTVPPREFLGDRDGK
ncbi:alpha/beta hydrolase [uncultured Microbacterium sp.]|uniref:alpha/beta hydrolase n=1 Tax=uncultured Microbacterium sp. TaxID=191216 RepID=UPI0028D75D6B|nr:alpha/beta hydrolase [uncultured Microbacterium sp.]